MISYIVDPINNVLWGNGQILIYLLLFAGFWFSYKLGFVQLRQFKYMFSVMKNSTRTRVTRLQARNCRCSRIK